MHEEANKTHKQQPSKALKATHIWSAVTRFLRWEDTPVTIELNAPTIDLEDEYQKACRTESYIEFAQRVALFQSGAASSSSSPKLRSFELLAATLLEPDEEKVLGILRNRKDLLKTQPEVFQLVSDYFEESRKSSTLCTALLKSIDRSRGRSSSIKKLLNRSSSTDNEILREICSLDVTDNLFSSSVLDEFHPVHEHYVSMQKKLEKLRKTAVRKLRCSRRFLKACGIVLSVGCFLFLVVTTLVVFIGVAAVVAGNGLKSITLPVDYVVRRLNKPNKQRADALERQWKQIEAVVQGTFVVVQDLDTMKRLVMRLGSEIEFGNRTVAFCVRHRDHGLILNESLQRLGRNQVVLGQLLDDLEENIYLSFMSINKARCLVVSELCLH